MTTLAKHCFWRTSVVTVHDMTIHPTFLCLNVSKFNKNVTLPAIMGGMGPPGPGPIMPIGPGIGPDGVGMLDGGGIAAPPEDDFEAPGVKKHKRLCRTHWLLYGAIIVLHYVVDKIHILGSNTNPRGTY